MYKETREKKTEGLVYFIALQTIEIVLTNPTSFVDEINSQLQDVFINLFRVYQNLCGYEKLYTCCIQICAPFVSQTDRF